MSKDRTTITQDTQPANDTPPQNRLGLSSTQVVGSALAAMSGAFLTSWAGTAGTLIGAAVASVVATVGAATYTWWLRRTSEAVRRTAAQVRQTALTTTVRSRTAGGSTVVETREAEPAEDPRRRTLPDLPWAKVLLASAVVLLVALAGITGIEGLTGRSLASYAGRDSSHSTTLGNAVDSGSTSTPKRSTTDNQDTGGTSGDTGTDGGSTTDSQDGSTGSTPTPAPSPTEAATPTPTPTPTPTTSSVPSPSASATPGATE